MISIIMPTYNRFDIAEETIQKTIAIKADTDFELIVVNDGEELPFHIQHPKLSIYKNPKKGVSGARNFGASVAKYPVLFFIDDDMWITAKTLSLIAALLQNKLLDDNYFNMNWEYPEYLKEELKAKKIGRYLLNSDYHTLEGRAGVKIDYTLPVCATIGVGSCSFCLTRENFIKAGGYNEEIVFEGEDVDMALRLKKQNIHSKLATEITCYHNQRDRLDINGFIERKYRGYQSQAKAGMIHMTDSVKDVFLKRLYPFYFLFEWVYTLIPNHSFFDKITFLLIGLLSSLVKTRAIQEHKTTRQQPAKR